MGRTNRLKPVFGDIADLRIGENRAVLADVYSAYVAPAAFADSAAHLPLERGQYRFGRETQFKERGYGEFKHDGWAAQQAVRIGGAWRNFLEDDRHEPHAAFPGVVALVNGNIRRQVTALLPLLKLGFV